MSVAVLMPFGGPDCEYRRRARDWVADRYRQNHPDWALCFGESGEPWSKGAAVADAFSQTTADVLVLADSDSFVDNGVLQECVAVCEGGIGWAIPHQMVYRLTEEETGLVLGGKPPAAGKVVRFPYTGPAGGGITVMRRDSYVAVNGVDERFYGWGGEDICLGMALWAIVGRFARMGSPLYHLWHPHPAPDLRGSPESEALVARYKAVRTDVAGMTALVREHRGPRTSHDSDSDDHARS